MTIIDYAARDVRVKDMYPILKHWSEVHGFKDLKKVFPFKRIKSFFEIYKKEHAG